MKKIINPHCQCVKHCTNDNVSKKDIWLQLYRNRELEISTLWQRSVFLGAFVILLFTGYGCYFCVNFFNGINTNAFINLVGLFLGILITLFGALWVFMAQGSKRWSEIYEKKIIILEESLGIREQFKYITEKYIDDFSKYDDEHKANSDLLSNNKKILSSAKMSPSKINIFIGWVIFGVGVVINLMHMFLLMGVYKIIFITFVNGMPEMVVYESYSIISFILMFIITVIFISVFLRMKKLFLHKSPDSQNDE